MHNRHIDPIVAFLKSIVWIILKYRYNEYIKRLEESRASSIRAQNWSSVSYIQGKIDGVSEIIKITEHLDREIANNSLDVDVALSVIENKSRLKT